MSRLNYFYNLSKPGIVYSNVFSAVAGYLYVGQKSPDFGSLMAMVVGLSFVIAAACAANNILERNTDAMMERTSKRELPRQLLSVREATAFTVICLAAGLALLYFFTSFAVTSLAAVLYVSYVFIYTPLKRYTIHSTLVGTLPGSLSIVIGYTLASGIVWTIDALLLFLTMATWQMAHFYSIALFRHKDYKAAGLPVFSEKYGAQTTRTAIIIFATLFLLSGVMLSVWGSATAVFGLFFIALAIYWLFYCIKKYNKLWPKKQFIASLKVLVGFCILLIADGILRQVLVRI